VTAEERATIKNALAERYKLEACQLLELSPNDRRIPLLAGLIRCACSEYGIAIQLETATAMLEKPG